MELALDAILAGTIQRPANGAATAIDKQPVGGDVAIGREGLTCDRQADRRYHGGPEMALLFYPADHYPVWRMELPTIAAKFIPGAFGENLSAGGICEETALIGDIWCAGSAVLQISQGRAPCSKLATRFGDKSMVKRVAGNGRGGWYLRVLETGVVRAGDAMRLIERPDHGWTVRRTADTILHKGGDEHDLAALAALETLSPEWRDKAKKAVG